MRLTSAFVLIGAIIFTLFVTGGNNEEAPPSIAAGNNNFFYIYVSCLLTFALSGINQIIRIDVLLMLVIYKLIYVVLCFLTFIFLLLVCFYCKYVIMILLLLLPQWIMICQRQKHQEGQREKDLQHQLQGQK